MQGFKRTAIGAVMVLGVAFTPAASARAAVTGPTALLAGTVATNGALTARVAINAEIWPNETVMRHLKGAVPTIRLKTVYTDAAGRWTLTDSLASLPSTYRGMGGQVNLGLEAIGGTRHAFYNTSLHPTGVGRYATNATLPAEVGIVRLELGTDKTKLGRAANHGATTVAQTTKAGISPSGTTVPPSCGSWISDGARGPFNAVWAAIYANGSALGSWEYDSGVSHRLAILAGINSNGFSGSGSMSITNSAGTSINSGSPNQVDNGLYSRIMDQQFHAYCWVPGTGDYTKYQMNPWYVYAPALEYNISHQYFSQCMTGYIGHNYTHYTGTNWDFTGGFTVYGTGYESQSGYSWGARLSYYFPSHQGLVCWNGNYGLSNAALWEGR